jgi:hypothetical protein
MSLTVWLWMEPLILLLSSNDVKGKTRGTGAPSLNLFRYCCGSITRVPGAAADGTTIPAPV